MANSWTGSIHTEGEYQTVASLASFTFTEGKTYTMQVQNECYLKISDAEFWIGNEKFNYTAGSDDLYIKTMYIPCTLTILEDA